MAPKYKLVYFNIQARGEPARLMFAAAGVQFEDCRVSFEDWATMKSRGCVLNYPDPNNPNRLERQTSGFAFLRTLETPQGSLPILEVDGGKLVLAQSGAINRYLAREFKMYGKNNAESSVIDLINDTLADLMPKRVAVVFAPDEKTQAEKKKELIEEHVPRFLDILEPIVAKYGKDGFAVGNALSLADVMLFTGLEFGLAVDTLNKEKDKYGALLKNREKFEKIPKIKAWLDKRPASDK